MTNETQVKTPNKKNKTLLSYGRKQIFTALFLLLFFALSTTSYFILRPFITSTADTISSQLIALTTAQANTFTKANPNLPLSLTNEDKYQRLNDVAIASKKTMLLPVLYLIKEHLSWHFKDEISLVLIENQTDFYWFQIDNKANSDWHIVGFSTDLIGTKPELTFLFLLVFLISLAVIFSLIISKSLNSPLLALENMIEKLAAGDFSARLPAHEFAEINRTFAQVNKLSDDFKNMLDQRVVFLAGISHDIRTPVTRLKLLLAIHEQTLAIEFTEKANTALNEIEALVRIYLDAGQLLVDENIEEVDIESFFIELCSNFSSELTKNIAVNSDIKCIQAINVQALKRVLINLMTNAIKYAPPMAYGDIAINIKNISKNVDNSKIDNAKLCITITDNGLGVKQEQLAEIYKPFYTAHYLNEQQVENIKQYAKESIKTIDNQSSGLGLAICRQICLSQGWSLDIQNKKTPQHGLTVQLTLSNMVFTTVSV